MPIYARKYAICALCWNMRKCGNKRNMRQSQTDMPSKYALTNRALGHIEGLTVPWVTLI